MSQYLNEKVILKAGVSQEKFNKINKALNNQIKEIKRNERGLFINTEDGKEYLYNTTTNELLMYVNLIYREDILSLDDFFRKSFDFEDYLIKMGAPKDQASLISFTVNLTLDLNISDVKEDIKGLIITANENKYLLDKETHELFMFVDLEQDVSTGDLSTDPYSTFADSNSGNSLFINLSNHSSTSWTEEQKNAAQIYGEIKDFSFPNIPAYYTEQEVTDFANQYVKSIIALKPNAVMCQGEFTFSYHVIDCLRKANIKVVAACSERIVSEVVEADGLTRKVFTSKFIRFREYV